jgi:hypothetical protein
MSIQLDKLKSDIILKIDIVGFYEEYLDGQSAVKFDSDGWSQKLRCPIHNDIKTPNFSFNVNTGGFKCFACGKGGSIFDFWLLKNGYGTEDKSSLKFALAALSSRSGIDIDEWSKTDGKTYEKTIDQEKRKKLEEISGKVLKTNKAETHDASNFPVPARVVDEFHNSLKPEHVSYLLGKRGLKQPTIKLFKIGWDETCLYKPVDGSSKWATGRIAIPVFNVKGECRNIRCYTNKTDPAYKMCNFVMFKGKVDEMSFGSPPRLFNVDKLVSENWEHVVICEGEFDSMLLYQELRGIGLDTWGTVTSTHGVKTFEPEWLPFLHGKHVYICFDCDEEGSIFASSAATKHFLAGIKSGIFKSVKIIKLPLDGTKEYKDITDYFMKCDFTINDFVELCSNTPELIAGGVSSDEASVQPIEVDNLVNAVLDNRYIDKRIAVPVAISGMTSKIYHAIREYEIGHCPLKKSHDGESCCHDNVGVSEIPYGHPIFIQSCMQAEERILKAIANIVCNKKQKCDVRPISKVVMEEYFVHQVIDRFKAEEVAGHLQNTQELVNVPIYALQPPGGVSIKPQNYLLTGYVRTHPNTGLSTLFAEKLDPLEDDWCKFNSKSKDNIDILKNLRDNFNVDRIIEQITNHVTRIYEADEILYAVLLAYLSPIQFIFNKEMIKGWINVAIIGDSGTGKSATYSRFSDWIGVGDLFSALSGSRTGLLYALKQRAGEWVISIGAYVRASGKIIAIDETQEMEADEVKRMAIAMENGFLKIEKVASGGYQTRTRTVFLLNPKRINGQAATISEFMYGAECLQNCFSPMFIRRLDLVVFTTGTHKHDFYNQPTVSNTQFELTSLMIKTLVFWAWTRTPDQITWEDDSTVTCLKEAIRLSEMFGYVDSIPIVSPQDFRLNLARLSTSFAILSCSFTDDIQGVVVKKEHVETVSALLEVIYTSSACDLAQLSDIYKTKTTIGDDYDIIKSYFESKISRDRSNGDPVTRKKLPFVQFILSLEGNEYINKRDLCDQLSVGSGWVSDKITGFRAYNLVEQTRFGYRRTKKFNIFMKMWKRESGVKSMLNSVYKLASDLSGIATERVGEETQDDVSERLISADTDPFE